MSESPKPPFAATVEVRMGRSIMRTPTTVVRETKTQWVDSSNRRWRKQDGGRVGMSKSAFSHTLVIEPDQ